MPVVNGAASPDPLFLILKPKDTVSPSAQLVSGDVTDVTTKSGKSGRSIVIWIGLSFEESSLLYSLLSSIASA